MGDVADILGMGKAKESSAADVASQMMNDAKPKGGSKEKRKKPKGMAREVYDLLGPDGIVPSMETNKVSTGFKNKRASALRGRWVWAPFTSSSRSDQQPFYHWVKADVQYSDYPYAKFNLKLDNIPMYTGVFLLLFPSCVAGQVVAYCFNSPSILPPPLSLAFRRRRVHHLPAV